VESDLHNISIMGDADWPVIQFHHSLLELVTNVKTLVLKEGNMKICNAQTLPFTNNDNLLYRHSLHEGSVPETFSLVTVQLVHTTGRVCERCLQK